MKNNFIVYILLVAYFMFLSLRHGGLYAITVYLILGLLVVWYLAFVEKNCRK